MEHAHCIQVKWRNVNLRQTSLYSRRLGIPKTFYLENIFLVEKMIRL